MVISWGRDGMAVVVVVVVTVRACPGVMVPA